MYHKPNFNRLGRLHQRSFDIVFPLRHQSILSNKHDKKIPPILIEPNTKIAAGTSHENVVTDNNIPITPVVVPEYQKQKLRHELIKPSFYNDDCTQVTSKNKMKKKNKQYSRITINYITNFRKTHSTYETNDNNNHKQVETPKHKFPPALPRTSNSLDTSIIPHEPLKKKLKKQKKGSQNN